MKIIKLITVLFLTAGLIAAVWLPQDERVLGSYVTSLRGRTRGQIINATRAAQALDGTVIEAGHEFSFNRTVGSWTPDRGYVLAPVSYDGELIVDWGGGVCQTSTTLYNAALIAGMEIVERHRHAWAPGYVPPGRDAAVAQRTTDLRLRNPYPYPLRLRALLTPSSVGFTIQGRQAGPQAEVVAETLATVPPCEVLKSDDRLPAGQHRLINHGKPGLRAAVYRTYLHGPNAGRRELISHDAYPAMNRIILIGR
ncbi:MAG TPA: VanW family protein [Armatimonadota bacterium]|jgi:vancomycin resistance protein YoaR